MIITTIENSWLLTKKIHQNTPYGLSGKLMSRHRCKTMQALDFIYWGIWFCWGAPTALEVLPPSHPSQRPADGRWRAGPLCQGGSWRRRWRCRCRWTPSSWSGWSRHAGPGSPQTPRGPWRGPCCRHRRHHQCSGKSVKDREDIVLFLWCHHNDIYCCIWLFFVVVIQKYFAFELNLAFLWRLIVCCTL